MPTADLSLNQGDVQNVYAPGEGAVRPGECGRLLGLAWGGNRVVEVVF